MIVILICLHWPVTASSANTLTLSFQGLRDNQSELKYGQSQIEHRKLTRLKTQCCARLLMLTLDLQLSHQLVPSLGTQSDGAGCYDWSVFWTGRSHTGVLGFLDYTRMGIIINRPAPTGACLAWCFLQFNAFCSNTFDFFLLSDNCWDFATVATFCICDALALVSPGFDTIETLYYCKCTIKISLVMMTV